MKKVLFSLVAVVMTISLAAQDFPDGGFENWEYTEGEYWDYQTDLLRTLNELYELNGVEMETILTSFRETEDVHEGNHAIRMTSGWFGTNAIFVPGAIATLNEPVTDSYVSDYVDLGVININQSYGFKPWRLTGYYKYQPVNGDSASIDMQFYYLNTQISDCEKFIIREETPEWTPFEIVTGLESSYYDVTEISMVFAASAAYNFANLEECAGQAGSSLYLDDLAFHYDAAGLVEPLMPVVKTSVYPNPSVDQIHFDFNKEVAANLVIYNLNGSEIATMPVNDTHADYNTSALANGSYLYRLIEGNTILSSGKFVVAK